MSYINRDYLVIQFQNFANKIKELLDNKSDKNHEQVMSQEEYDRLTEEQKKDIIFYIYDGVAPNIIETLPRGEEREY